MSFFIGHIGQVEDVLNKKKPPPQILDLNGKDTDANHYKATLLKVNPQSPRWIDKYVGLFCHKYYL